MEKTYTLNLRSVACQLYLNKAVGKKIKKKKKETTKTKNPEDFPDGLVAKASSSQCSGPRFHPWSGN